MGFQVKLLASGLDYPRIIRTAPNGDIFIAESGAGSIRVLRLSDGDDKVTRNEIFASGLNQPFGIAFFPRGNDPHWVYVANTDSVVRLSYRNGDLKAAGKPDVHGKVVCQSTPEEFFENATHPSIKLFLHDL